MSRFKYSAFNESERTVTLFKTVADIAKFLRTRLQTNKTETIGRILEYADGSFGVKLDIIASEDQHVHEYHSERFKTREEAINFIKHKRGIKL